MKHQELIERIEEFDAVTSASRKKSQRDRDYYDHKQFDDARLAEYQQRGQPAIVFNRIQPKVNYLVGTERSNRTDPKVLPRTPKHSADSEAITQGLRYVADESVFDASASESFFNQCVEGTGGVIVEFNAERKEIEINYIPWDRLYWDVHSRRTDFSDANHLGMVVWLYFEDAIALAKRIGGDAKEVELQSYINSATVGGSLFDDKPETTRWISNKSRRVQIFQEYYREGSGWKEVYFHKGGIIKQGDSPYRDCDDLPTNPIKLRSSYVDRKGNRFGAVRGWIGPQDEINDRRSKALHQMHSNLTIGSEGAVDVPEMKAEKNKPDGHIKITNPNARFEFIDKQSDIANQLTLLQEAKSEIDAQGVNASLTGSEPRDLSGRAMLARQQGGLTELGPLFDIHKMWKRAVFKACFERMKQFWEEKWIRVTDKPEDIRFVAFNRPVTYRMMIEAHAQSTGEDIPPELLGHPDIDAVAMTENDLSTTEVDILIQESPDQATLQQEQFVEVAKLASVRGDIPTRALINLSSMPGKDDVLKEIEGDEEQQAQQQALQQAELDMQKAERQSDIEKNKAAAAKLLEEAKAVALENQTREAGIAEILTHLSSPNTNNSAQQ